MLKEILVDRLDLFVDPTLLEHLVKLDNTLIAAETANYLCMMIEAKKSMQEAHEAYQNIHQTQRKLKRMVPMVRVSPIRSEKNLLERRKTDLFTLQSSSLVKLSKLVSERALLVGKGNIASERFPELLIQLKNSSTQQLSPAEIINALEHTSLGIHPGLKAELEAYAELWDASHKVEQPLTDGQKRQKIWAEKFRIELPTDEAALQLVLERYFMIMDEFVVSSQDLGSYFSSESIKDDEYYLNIFDLLYVISPQHLYTFLKDHSQADTQIEALQLLIWYYGENTLSDHAFRVYAAYLSGLSQKSFLAFLPENDTISKKATVFEHQDIDVLLGKGKLPKSINREYSTHVLNLLSSTKAWVSNQAKENEQTLPGYGIAKITKDAIHRLLGEELFELWEKRQGLFMKVLRPKIKRSDWLSQRWLLEEVEAMVVILKYDQKSWGGGGEEEDKIFDFMHDLIRPSRISDR